MYDKLNELRKIKEEYENRLRTEGRAVLDEILKQFFQDNPKIIGLRWKQYTPFFNDGEPCFFRLRSIDCQVAEEFAKAEIKYSDGDGWTSDGHYGLHDKSELCAPLRKLDSEFNRSADLLEAALGDHVRVTATPTGIDVDEYVDHE